MIRVTLSLRKLISNAQKTILISKLIKTKTVTKCRKMMSRSMLVKEVLEVKKRLNLLKFKTIINLDSMNCTKSEDKVSLIMILRPRKDFKAMMTSVKVF